MDMDTTFEWMQDCWYPVLSSQSCWVDWTNNTTITQQRCYSYHYFTANWESTAAVYTGWVVESYAGITHSYWRTQRRECYSDYLVTRAIGRVEE